MCSASPASSTVTLLATGSSQSVLAEVGAAQVNPQAYTAHGVQSGAQTAISRLGFNGQLRERPQAWFHLGHGQRIYSPVLMRFHSPDRLSPFEQGGLNPYAYCLGDPINLGDPTGRIAETIHYLSLVSSALMQFTGLLTLAMPRILANPPAGSWRARYVARKPGVAGPVGGLDAVATVTGIMGGLVGAGATVLNMQQAGMASSQELMVASMGVGLGVLAVKVGIAYTPTSYAPGSRWRKFGVFLHGDKKIAKAEAEADLQKARDRSRSPTPYGGGAGPEDIQMQEIQRASAGSVQPTPPAAPERPVPLPRTVFFPVPVPRVPRKPHLQQLATRLRQRDEIWV